MKDPFKVQLGERIRMLRKAVGLTQERLAEKADLSVNFIGNTERGENVPSLKTLRRVAKALGVHLKDLLDFPYVDVAETIDEILTEINDEVATLLKRKEWEIDELRGVRNLIRIAGRSLVK